MAGAGLPARRRVPPLPVPGLPRPHESGPRPPPGPAEPPVPGRGAVARLPAPRLPGRLAGAPRDPRGGARPALPARCGGGRPAPTAVARLRARTPARRMAPDRRREGERDDRRGGRQRGAAAPSLPGRARRAVPVLPPRPAGGGRRRAGDLRVRPRGGRDESAVRRWGVQHAALWAALAAAGRTVEVVVAGRDPVRLAAAGRVVDRWMREPAARAAEREETAARFCEQARREEELESIRAALVAADHDALTPYGDLNGALARMRDLASAEGAGTGRPKPAIPTQPTTPRCRRLGQGGSRGATHRKPGGFRTRQVFLRHTCRAGSLPNESSLAGRPAPAGTTTAGLRRTRRGCSDHATVVSCRRVLVSPQIGRPDRVRRL